MFRLIQEIWSYQIHLYTYNFEVITVRERTTRPTTSSVLSFSSSSSN
eukprot:UN20664